MGVPLAANAQPITGLYISGSAGANIMSDQQIKSFTVPNSRFGVVTIPFTGNPNGRNIGMDAGFAGQASVGWGVGSITSFGGPRLEIEGLYLYNRVSGGSNSSRFNSSNPSLASRLFNFGGTEQKPGFFGNFIWDFDVGSKFFYPYLGAGIGGMWSEWDPVRIYNNITNNPNIRINNTQSSFAYQGILGASFPIAAVPGLAVITDFRFESLVGHRNYSASYTGSTINSGFVTNVPTVLGTAQNYNYTFMLGVKYAFNAAPPPPPPAPIVAPAPAPARSYLVFFDWDRYNLTERARQIIREAAENSTRVQYTRIEVNGYTDTSGTKEYNQRLSVRRADAVAAELVKDGVPKSALTIQGFGQTHLLVPTADGVREPQNRRVEIIIQ